MRSATKNRVGRDKEYLAWIHTLPCAVCIWPWRLDQNGIAFTNVQKSPTEAAHTGPHGMSVKSDDRTAIPLCALEHHREGPLSYHKLGATHFFERHKLDCDALVKALNERFYTEHSSVLSAREVMFG